MLAVPHGAQVVDRYPDHYPESPLFYRRLDRDFPRAVAAEGCWIVDERGKRYLDASGGAMVVNVGHGVAEIAQAMADQARTLAYVNGTQLTNAAAEDLARALAALLPEPLFYSYFLGSGSEAIEAAVKLARQYWVESGRPGKWKVISRVPSYHGNTLAALSLSGREHYRRVYAPLLTEFPRIPAPDPYRHPDCRGDAACPACSGAALEEAILEAGPETVAAFVFEPVGGSSGGAVVPSADYYRRIEETCRRYDVLLLADEVMTGVGRTGRWFAFQHYDFVPDFVPDVLVLGKGLNGGYAPLSALVASRRIVDALARGSGAFNHAQTYSHTPVTCAAGLATLRYLEQHRLVERCALMSPVLFEALGALRELPAVGDVRGIGLLAAVELVRDRATRAPYPRSAKLAERVAARALAEGLVVWPNAGHADGVDGDLVMIGPPFTISAEEIAEIARRLGAAIAAETRDA
jgi:adenosylmethionine-8-amino-7-oxononanoate aminotransferase